MDQCIKVFGPKMSFKEMADFAIWMETCIKEHLKIIKDKDMVFIQNIMV